MSRLIPVYLINYLMSWNALYASMKTQNKLKDMHTILHRQPGVL